MEHVAQLVARRVPGSDGVTQEDEVLRDSLRVQVDHEADAAEGRLLLVVVPDVP